jgi:threonine dehydratase
MRIHLTSKGEAPANKIIDIKGSTFIYPYNDMNVILGQGTVAKELLEFYPGLDYIFSLIGDGGLVSGTILAADSFGVHCKVVGTEPEIVNDAYRSLKTGKIEANENTDTIADGLKTQLGSLTFPIIQQNINKIITVSEQEIIHAMRIIWERMKIVIEASGAVVFAALLKEKSVYQNKKMDLYYRAEMWI